MKKSIYQSSPNRIFFYRKKRGLTQHEVALIIGLKNGSHISNYERGVATPSLVRALELALALNTPLEFLFEDTVCEIKQDLMVQRERLYRKKLLN